MFRAFENAAVTKTKAKLFKHQLDRLTVRGRSTDSWKNDWNTRDQRSSD
jgi:hypothetical protein